MARILLLLLVFLLGLGVTWANYIIGAGRAGLAEEEHKPGKALGDCTIMDDVPFTIEVSLSDCTFMKNLVPQLSLHYGITHAEIVLKAMETLREFRTRANELAAALNAPIK